MRITLCAGFLILSILLSAQMPGVELDGHISYAERFDTNFSKSRLLNGEDILLRKDSSYYYFGIQNTHVGASNLILSKGDTCIVIHISGSVARAIYKRVAKDSFEVIKPILWVTRNPESWDLIGNINTPTLKVQRSPEEIKTDLRQNLVKHGYTSTNLLLGSYREVEVLLDRRRFKGYRLLIQYVKNNVQQHTVQSQLALYPFQAGMIQQLAAFRTFLGAVPDTKVRVELNEASWELIE